MAHSIELEYLKPPHGVEDTCCYKVTAIVNSLNYKPGDILLKEEVETLCSQNHWTVRIK